MEQQTQIEIESGEQSSPFEQSMSQLLDMLDISTQKRGTHFYKATWDTEDHTRLTDVTRMTAKATGALKEERFGEFRQAQLRITENRAGEDEPTQRFVWCEVDSPQRPGTLVKLNLRALYSQYGYEVCDTKNVAKTLIDRVVTIDDCLALMSSLEGRKGDIGKGLAQKVNQFTADFLYRDLGDESLSVAEEADKLFALINHCQAFGKEVPKWVQGYLVSNLLQVISKQRVARRQLEPGEAMTILETGISEGIISNPGSMQRILGCPALYMYPYGTELLHKNLQGVGTKGPINIFGVERVKFATSYIVTRLLEAEATLPTTARDYLGTVGLRNIKERDHEELYKMMNGLVRVVDGDEAAEQFTHPRAIGSMFEHVLAKLHGENSDAAQIDFDQKSVEIVEAILEPLSMSRLGAQVLLDEAELEEW